MYVIFFNPLLEVGGGSDKMDEMYVLFSMSSTTKESPQNQDIENGIGRKFHQTVKGEILITH